MSPLLHQRRLLEGIVLRSTFVVGTPNVNKPLPARPDFKFFDDEYNKWTYIRTIEPLKQSIQRFAGLLPIATAFHKNNRKEP
jgi:hypothetical protein